MPKELAMVERNEKGREIRRYFIECERRLLSGSQRALKVLPVTITSEQQNALQQIVANKAQGNRNTFAYIWSRFNNHYGLGSYKQLPAGKLTEAMANLLAMPLQEKPKPIGNSLTNAELQNSDHAREKIAKLRGFGDRLPDYVRQDFMDHLRESEVCVVRGWTEIDEALLQIMLGVAYLRRFRVKH